MKMGSDPSLPRNEAGVQVFPGQMDSRFRGNDALRLSGAMTIGDIGQAIFIGVTLRWPYMTPSLEPL